MQVFDGHCDTIYACYEKNASLFWENPSGHLDLKRMKRFSHYAQFFAIFEDGKNKSRAQMEGIFSAQYQVLARELKKHREHIILCRTKEEAQEAFQEGKVAAFLSVEGAELLGCNVASLDRAYIRGVRAVNLTWNRANELSGSAVEEIDRGLSPMGNAFVLRMQELGMLVDVSHLSDPGFWDVITMAKRPIIASHSNSRTIWNHPRNLTDAQFLAIKQVGGVAGLNMYSSFLGDQPDFDTVLAHLEHFLSLEGAEHVALGGDWDGCDTLPRGMEGGISGLEGFYEYLLRRNYSETLIDKLYHQNLMRVVGEVCTI